ncbi:MAG: Gfo/Idh/MocA family oxidoreductase [Bryobacterales bacterium]|nr:Gfo/Idh/MocA family oxidoreductase [Bryobacterales bacterium]
MDEVRIGMVGCGLFGESHLQAFRAVAGARVTAVYDTDPAVAGERAKAFHIPKICASLEELCAEDLDAVDVVTPEQIHLEPVLKAVSAGKHVFVEKPMATVLEECDRMIEAARRAGRILMVGQILRFETKYAMLRDEVASGGLGRIVSMHARRNRRKSLLPRYGRNHPAIENCIHDIDLMLWYTRDRIRRVRGYGRKATGSKHHDTFWGILEFENGALGVVETIWLLPEACGIPLDDSLQVVGDRGVANVSLVPGSLTFWREGGYESPDVCYDPRVGGAAKGALRDELAYFCDCVRANRMPEIITPVEAKNAVRVSLALIESGYSDAPVDIEEWN